MRVMLCISFSLYSLIFTLFPMSGLVSDCFCKLEPDYQLLYSSEYAKETGEFSQTLPFLRLFVWLGSEHTIWLGWVELNHHGVSQSHVSYR